jgi:outer membrane protein assembly factor BamB
VLFGSYDEKLYALDAATGKELWSFQAEGPVHCTPGLAGDQIFVGGCDGYVRAIDLETGAENQHLFIGSYMGASPAYDRGKVYAGNFDNTIMAFDVENYTVLWDFDPQPRDFPFYSSAALTRDRLILGGRDKVVYCLDRETGNPIWTYTTRARVDSSPAISGNRVFIGSSDSHLYELDLETGAVNWFFATGGAIVSSPAIAGGRLIIGSQDGILYCFGRKESDTDGG